MLKLRDEAATAAELEELSIMEIVDAAAARGAPHVVRRAVEMMARAPSRRLGKILARFDRRIADAGLQRAAHDVLRALGASLEVKGAVPSAGGVLVVTNHPGAYDAFATMAAIGRDDVALVASERAFLRAMPHVTQHLVFVTDSRTAGSATGRAAGLRSALAWLEAGRVLVQFGAGAIEPDPRFTPAGEDVLGPWLAGTGVLASRAGALGASIVPALVSGVHSRRAKSLALVRWAERRGITTIAPLIQATLPGFRDVEVQVRFGQPIARSLLAVPRDECTALLRSAVASLRPKNHRRRN